MNFYVFTSFFLLAVLRFVIWISCELGEIFLCYLFIDLFYFISFRFVLFCFDLFCFILFCFTLPEITSRRPDRPLGLYAITYSYLIYHLIFHWLLFPALLLFLFASNISYISSEHYHFTVPTYFTYWLVNYLIYIHYFHLIFLLQMGQIWYQTVFFNCWS